MKRLLSFFAIVVLLGAQSLQAQWIQTNRPYGGFITSVAVSGSNLFAGTWGGGVFLSTNPATRDASWTAVNTGLTNTIVWSFAVHDFNLFAGTGDGGVWRRPLSEMVTTPILHCKAKTATQLIFETIGIPIFLFRISKQGVGTGFGFCMCKIKVLPLKKISVKRRLILRSNKTIPILFGAKRHPALPAREIPQPPFAISCRKPPESCSKSTTSPARKCACWSMRDNLPV
jgi:hypothetical protein